MCHTAVKVFTTALDGSCKTDDFWARADDNQQLQLAVTFEFYIAIIEFYIHNNSFPKLYSEYFKRIVIDPHFMNKHKFTLKIVQTVITNMPKCFVRIVFNYFFEIRIINFRQRMTNYKYICHTFCVLKQRYFLLDYFRRMLGKNIFIIWYPLIYSNLNSVIKISCFLLFLYRGTITGFDSYSFK